MKPYYRIKGNYPDGRNKIVIEYKRYGKIISKTLPKPEVLLELMREKKDRLKVIKSTHKKRQLRGVHLPSPSFP